MEPLRLVWLQPALRLLCISSFFFCMVQVSLSTFLTSYLTIECHMPLIVAGALFSVAQVAGVVGRIAWGLFSDRWLGGASTLGLLGLAMSAMCALTIEGAGVLPTAVVTACLALYGATAIGWNGVFLAEVARQAPPNSTGLATGGALAMTYLGAVVGPPVFGVLAAHIGSYGESLIIVSAPAAMCGMALLRARRAFDQAPSS
jgi:sugar phosphate permease